ncbi:Peptidase domain protein OS=Solibacter usitatus (strain Ellin6076) GN=Acid_3763 PE=4 SV=1 [Gemmataceae bacterium]|nr:Peptidase domain protein OS=Solibacter usitatus (strain Ellin6076) GN=Acid_3763 PE=4 SV=1 [Gemmataceae bacterium]VTU00384.1 Peptidase domain protein OS=Solibacter usitatus (strain Ellin6076) GN=Acid_3763 PE=4 SV=1 [Gemmataceae bacterium]
MASVSRPHPGFALCVLCVLCGEPVLANPPTVSYVFPAGGQRGTTVPVRVGGLFLHDKCAFDLASPGVKASPELVRDARLWFEGPVLPLPDSQRQEDYPADMRGSVTLAADAKVGPVRGRVFTSQGGAGGLVFVVGELPEVVEAEVAGDPIPKALALPVTANGRVFPYEDIDLWEFDGEPGKTVTAFVHAPSLNSPLVPQLDVLDAKGNVVAEQMLHPCVGTDASVRFTPKVAGKYRVRITDARTLGGPAYVYRLTVTTADVPQFHFPLKVKPDGLKDVTDARVTLTAPVALNGRIEKPGAANEWKLDLKKGGRYALDLIARRAESPLCGVVTITDATGKEVAKAEATETADPGPLAFSPSVDGTFTVRVSEKYRGRGGPNFAYRLAVTDATAPAGEPGFRLTLATDAVTLPRSGTVKVKVTAERTGGYAGPIVVKALDLPKGVTATPVIIPRNQPSAELTLTAGADAPIATSALKIEGVGIAGVTARLAGSTVVPGTRFVPETTDVRLAVALPTPFKIVDEYIMTSAARGEVYKRKYKLDRGGFDGVIEVQLADKQARHLQGVTGPVLALKSGETNFEYPAYLPPWMELGRTCRVCVMATAKVKDPVDGREHTVSFSSTEQNQQMIVVVSPGRLDMSLDRTSLRAEPGGEVRLPVTVARDKNLSGPAKVEAVLPAHWKGVTVAPLVIPADRDAGELVLRFAKDCGPFNAPLVVRATVEAKDTPVTAEAKVEVVR